MHHSGVLLTAIVNRESSNDSHSLGSTRNFSSASGLDAPMVNPEKVAADSLARAKSNGSTIQRGVHLLIFRCDLGEHLGVR